MWWSIAPLAILFLVYYITQVSQKPRSLPGPFSYPVVGNALNVAKSHEWIQYAEWGKRYGPIFRIRIFSQTVIIINSLKVASDLLEKQSAIFSDRPRLVMAGELMGWNKGVTLIESGERHRNYRRLLQSTLSKSGSRQFYVLQQEEAYGFVKRLAGSPHNLVSHIRRAVAASIVRITYGHTIKTNEDEYIIKAEDAQAKFSRAAIPNAYLVDSLPLRSIIDSFVVYESYHPIVKYVPSWFPFANFKRDAAKWRQELYELTRKPFLAVKQQVEKGTASPSYVSQSLAKLSAPSTTQDEEDIMYSALSLYTGGADTTVSSIHTFILALVLHPEVQTKAKTELDRVIGQDRLPVIDDRDNLPYINACVKEVFRWNPAIPLGVAHLSKMDVVYDGYHIPAGATIITNIWGMMRDETMYSNPSEFNPDRWLTGSIDSIQHNFGFGRRICPGMWTADASLFIIMACVFFAFDIKPAVRQDNQDIIPKVEYSSGMISHPKPFPLSIQPRNSNILKLFSHLSDL